MSYRTIKFESFGAPFEERNKEYLCNKIWPDSAKIQCGDKGIVAKKGGSNYITAFFEVFNGDDFIRGEGKDLIEAEEKAFEKLSIMNNCVNHNYSRVGSTEQAECSLCGHTVRGYYPPESSCSSCGKLHTALKISESPLCVNHYIEKAEQMDFSIDREVINKIKKNVFEKIKASKNKEKNLIEEILSKSDNFECYTDIPDDDYRVEMSIDKLKEVERNIKFLTVLLQLKLNENFDEEYKFVSHFEELMKVNKMSIYNKVYKEVRDTIDLLSKNNLIKSDVADINNSYTMKDPKAVDDLIDFYEDCVIAMNIADQHNENKEKLLNLVLGNNIDTKHKILSVSLATDIMDFYSKIENKSKPKIKL